MIGDDARYYNTARTYRSLDQDAPVSRPVQQIGRIVSHALVGGLHHQYLRIQVFGTHNGPLRAHDAECGKVTCVG